MLIDRPSMQALRQKHQSQVEYIPINKLITCRLVELYIMRSLSSSS